MEGVHIPPNIAAAIRRSQEARRALRLRRRRAAVLIGMLGLASAVPLSLSFADFGTGDMVQAAVAKAESLVDMLGKRSPGQRTEAQLTKTKHKQRALAKMQPLVRKPPAEAVIGSPLVPMPVELASLVMPPPELVPGPIGQIDIGPPPSLGTIVSPPGGGGIVAPPGGGGSPPITNPTPQPSEPVIVTPPAVPEPGTWMTMLLGFGLIGWHMRRRRPARLQQA